MSRWQWFRVALDMTEGVLKTLTVVWLASYAVGVLYGFWQSNHPWWLFALLAWGLSGDPFDRAGRIVRRESERLDAKLRKLIKS